MHVMRYAKSPFQCRHSPKGAEAAGAGARLMLTPATWRREATQPAYISEVASVRDTAQDLPLVPTPTPVVARSLAAGGSRMGPGAGYLVIGSLPAWSLAGHHWPRRQGDWLAITYGGPKLQPLASSPPDRRPVGVESWPLAPVTFLPLTSH